MKAKELRERTDAELVQLENDTTRELWKARVNNFTNQLDDTAKLRRLRREVARLKTLQNEKNAKRS